MMWMLMWKIQVNFIAMWAAWFVRERSIFIKNIIGGIFLRKKINEGYFALF